MTCPKCEHQAIKKFGTYGKTKIQRFRCRDCGATFSPEQPKPLGSHTTPVDNAARIVAMLCEGMSIRAVSRLTGVHKNTIMRLLVTIGQKCERLMDARIRNLTPRRVQCDEVWSFVGCKQKRVTELTRGKWGDAWLWLALDGDSKLMIAWHLGSRERADAARFVNDLASRLSGRVQLTTDGYPAYLAAVEQAFGSDVDYAMLNKVYASSVERRYSPARLIDVERIVIRGNPDPAHISTSFIERSNLTIRMALRRFTRLTNAFSKKFDNLRAAVAVFIAWYNFCRPHQSLRVTPAMEAGLTDHIWSIQELLAA